MRIMAIDYGDAHTGIAISDPTGFLTGFTTVINAYRPEAVAEQIAALAKEHGAEELVLGHPINMDGTRGGQAEKAQAFGKVLSDAGLDVRYQDERMTTVTAERVLISGSVRREDRKQCVDKLAAAVILEQWLASQSGAAERGMNHGE